MRFLALTQGYVAIVDDEDYDYLRQWKWHVSKKGGKMGYYACRNHRTSEGKKQSRLLHYEVLRLEQPLPDGMVIDHSNRDPLDCRKANLRKCTRSENIRNQGPSKRNGTSEYKGVFFIRKKRKWAAAIKVHRVKYHVGLFKNEYAAVNAYNIAVCEKHGIYGHLNHWRGPSRSRVYAEGLARAIEPGVSGAVEWLKRKGIPVREIFANEETGEGKGLDRPGGVQLLLEFNGQR